MVKLAVIVELTQNEDQRLKPRSTHQPPLWTLHMVMPPFGFTGQ